MNTTAFSLAMWALILMAVAVQREMERGVRWVRAGLAARSVKPPKTKQAPEEEQPGKVWSMIGYNV